MCGAYLHADGICQNAALRLTNDYNVMNLPASLCEASFSGSGVQTRMGGSLFGTSFSGEDQREGWRSLAALASKSELFRNTGLLQHCVGGVPGQDFLVNRKTPMRHRAVPDFMVSSARRISFTRGV
jgi:hypothetical protein